MEQNKSTVNREVAGDYQRDGSHSQEQPQFPTTDPGNAFTIEHQPPREQVRWEYFIWFSLTES